MGAPFCSTGSPSLCSVLHCTHVSPAFVSTGTDFVVVHPLSACTGASAPELTSTNGNHFVFAVAVLNVQQNRHPELGFSVGSPSIHD